MAPSTDAARIQPGHPVGAVRTRRRALPLALVVIELAASPFAAHHWRTVVQMLSPPSAAVRSQEATPYDLKAAWRGVGQTGDPDARPSSPPPPISRPAGPSSMAVQDAQTQAPSAAALLAERMATPSMSQAADGQSSPAAQDVEPPTVTPRRSEPTPAPVAQASPQVTPEPIPKADRVPLPEARADETGLVGAVDAASERAERSALGGPSKMSPADQSEALELPPPNPREEPDEAVKPTPERPTQTRIRREWSGESRPSAAARRRPMHRSASRTPQTEPPQPDPLAGMTVFQSLSRTMP